MSVGVGREDRPAACCGTGRRPASASPEASAGHRGWKRQPDGIRVGSGISPRSTIGSSPVHLRYDGQQRLRVGVLGRGQHLLRRPGLDHPAEVHHRDPVGDVPRQPEVVGDHEDAETELLTELEQEREDLAADRRVEAGDRLVGDQQLRLEGERAGDQHALPLATGQLVRVAQEQRLRRPQPGRRQGGRHPLGLARPRLGDQLVDPQALGDRVVDGVPRVERAERVLEHELDVAPQGLEGAGGAAEGLSLPADLAGDGRA